MIRPGWLKVILGFMYETHIVTLVLPLHTRGGSGLKEYNRQASVNVHRLVIEELIVGNTVKQADVVGLNKRKLQQIGSAS
jgi:hypothetical protein